jgi:rhomboid protease GluP
LLVFGAKFGPRIAGGEWWRLVTAGFLHAGVFHILMNSWVLFDLGPRVEDIFGTARFLVIYLVSSAFGFWASMLWSPYVPSIGASAAACGLIGAMLAYARRTGSSMIWSFYMRWIIMIAIIGLLPGFSIDNAAHFGGFAAGYALAFGAGTPRIASPVESLWKLAAGFAVLITAACFLLAYASLSRALGS